MGIRDPISVRDPPGIAKPITMALSELSSNASLQRRVLLANGLYLVSMLLVLTLGSLAQWGALGWGLIATELGLILVPALLWIRLSGLSVSAAVPLNRFGGSDLVIGAALGLGAWALSNVFDALGVTLLGYRPPSMLGLAPADPMGLTTLALALAFFAPVCEEILFRGVLLHAYSPLGRRISLALVSGLFVMFHFRLQGALALFPLALATGVLAQRTRSLWPSIVAHAVHNGVSVALMLINAIDPVALSGEIALTGLGVFGVIALLVGIAAAWSLKRRKTEPLATTTPIGGRVFWPLAIASALFLAGAGLELAQGRYPEVLADPRLQLEPSTWSEPTTATYDLKNVAGTVVGRSTCLFTPEADRVAFDCRVEQRRFELQVGQSYYAGGAYSLTGAGHWQADTMRLLDADYHFQGESLEWTAALTLVDDALQLKLDTQSPVSVPADSVVAAEWPWRMMALPFDRALFWGARLTLLDVRPGLMTGQDEPSVVQVVSLETIQTPTESVRAYRVRLGRETAWYRLDRPHTLIQFDDGYGVTWSPAAAP